MMHGQKNVKRKWTFGFYKVGVISGLDEELPSSGSGLLQKRVQ